MPADRSARDAHVLVTGGAGFLGARLVRRLLERGARVTVLDDLSTGSLEGLPHHPRLRVVTGSVLDAGALADAARGAGSVHHLASVVGMALATRRAAHALAVSDRGTAAVLQATGDAPAVLYSSSAVYGLARAEGAREDAPADEADALAYDGGTPGYAVGKLALERHGLAAAAAGRPVLVVRPFNVVGPGQSDAYGMVLPTFVAHALRGEPLPVHGDGRQRRAFADADVFTDCVLRLADALEAGAPATGSDRARDASPVVNVGCPQDTSVLELARLVIEEVGGDPGLRFLPYDAVYPGRRDVPVRAPDVSRLERRLGPVAWPSVRAIVRGMLAPQAAPTG